MTKAPGFISEQNHDTLLINLDSNFNLRPYIQGGKIEVSHSVNTIKVELYESTDDWIRFGMEILLTIGAIHSVWAELMVGPGSYCPLLHLPVAASSSHFGTSYLEFNGIICSWLSTTSVSKPSTAFKWKLVMMRVINVSPYSKDLVESKRTRGSYAAYFSSVWNYIDVASISIHIGTICMWFIFAWKRAADFSPEIHYDIYKNLEVRPHSLCAHSPNCLPSYSQHHTVVPRLSIELHERFAPSKFCMSAEG
jgi:hypothetical protein